MHAWGTCSIARALNSNSFKMAKDTNLKHGMHALRQCPDMTADWLEYATASIKCQQTIDWTEWQLTDWLIDWQWGTC